MSDTQARQFTSPRATARAQAPATRLDGTPIRVLVVDDEPSLAELLASVLRYEGWEIRTAGDGAEAVRTAREFRPDAVVVIGHAGWLEQIAALGEVSGIEVVDYASYIRALEQRRAAFKELGALATDHAVVTPYTARLSDHEAAAS